MGLHYDECEDDGVKCPYCGDVYEDDVPNKDTEWECDECGHTFDVEVEYTATYYSTKLESELEHQQKQLDYWKNPDPKHAEHANAIRKSYEDAVAKAQARIEKDKQRLARK